MPNRREALKQLGWVGTGVALGGVLASCAPSLTEAQNTDQDLAILNFALNLEYLEAEFYLRATTGQGLPPEDLGAYPGPVTVPSQTRVNFTNPDFQGYAEDIARDEKHHVEFLRAAIKELGGTPVDRPAIDLVNSFNAAAQAAGLGSSFNPFANQVNFLLGAFVFEDVGVTAYNGAAPLITNKQVVLANAAGILAVEAYHAGAIRSVLYGLGPEVRRIADAIEKVRDADGKGRPIVVDGQANIVSDNANGVAFSRTVAQVLKVVYLGGSKRGGFFPEGLNGALR